MTTETEMFALLAKRFPSPVYVLMRHVANGTGYARSRRTADALAMGTWPSRGLELVGFEIKVSRSDWLRELKAPEKAEEVFRFCDRWYMVVDNADIVRDGELPHAWGLLVRRGKVLVEASEALKLEPQPISRLFLASVLRSVFEDYVPKSQVETLATEKAEQKVAADKNTDAAKCARLEQQVAELQDLQRKFEAASGIDIQAQRWELGRVGAAVREIVRSNGALGMLSDRLREVEQMAARIAQTSKDQQEALRHLPQNDHRSEA